MSDKSNPSRFIPELNLIKLSLGLILNFFKNFNLVVRMDNWRNFMVNYFFNSDGLKNLQQKYKSFIPRLSNIYASFKSRTAIPSAIFNILRHLTKS